VAAHWAAHSPTYLLNKGMFDGIGIILGEHEGTKIVGVDLDYTSYQLSSALFDMLDYGDKVYFQDILSFNSPLLDLMVGDYSQIPHKQYYTILKHISSKLVEGGFIISIVDEEVASDKHVIANSKDLSNDLILFGLLHLPKGILKNQSKSILIFQKKVQKYFNQRSFYWWNYQNFPTRTK